MAEADKKLFSHMNLGERQILTPREAALALAVSVQTIYNFYQEGRLEGAAISKGVIRIERQSVVKVYVETHNSRPVPLPSAPKPAKATDKPSGKRGPGWVRGY